MALGWGGGGFAFGHSKFKFSTDHWTHFVFILNSILLVDPCQWMCFVILRFLLMCLLTNLIVKCSCMINKSFFTRDQSNHLCELCLSDRSSCILD